VGYDGWNSPTISVAGDDGQNSRSSPTTPTPRRSERLRLAAGLFLQTRA
jgi:hypothetical protein